MGEIKRGILGGVNGKVGTVVGATWKEISYVRALPINVENPRTPKQLHQRAKFATTIALLRPLVPYVRHGYRLLADDKTGYNAAVSYIMQHAIEGSGTQLSIDYERVLMARGNLMPVFGAKAVVEEGSIAFSWNDNSGMGDALETDLAMPLVYNKARQQAIYSLAAAGRNESGFSMELPDEWNGEPLAVYLAFCSEDGKGQTNSQCLINDEYAPEADEPTGDNTGGSTSGDDDTQLEDPLG